MDPTFALELAPEGKATSTLSDLYAAILRNDTETAKDLLSGDNSSSSFAHSVTEKWDVDDGIAWASPLYAAVAKKNLEMVEFLLSLPRCG